MKQSILFGKTKKSAAKEEVSVNAQLLIRAGFIDKVMSGVYTYLPLGLKVLRKIQSIIREEIEAVGGQEVLMPALTPKENWEKTGRWSDFDALFRLKSATNKEYALGATHEEIVTPLVQRFVKSYKDLPVAVFQIQDKFRDEVRAKSGLLRGREFNMKDLYSFHADESDLDSYHEKVKQAYFNIFSRCGLDAKIVEASGGSFSKLSHEFQVYTETGEDTVRYCEKCGLAQNIEISQLAIGDICPSCQTGKILETRAVEVGNIFKLYTKYSKPFDFKYVDKNGNERDIIMGCYGIGPSRLMGTIAEILHDDKGLIWPKSVAPADIHLISLGEDADILDFARDIYEKIKSRYEVIFDDRQLSNGEKLADSDLIGLPLRIIVSAKTLKTKSVEIKFRNSDDLVMVEIKKLNEFIEQNV